MFVASRCLICHFVSSSVCLATRLTASNYNSRLSVFGHSFRLYSLLSALLLRWLDLYFRPSPFLCSFSTTSVKILGLLPLFAAAIAKLIFRSFSTFFPVVVAVEDNGKGIVFSLFMQLLQQPLTPSALVLL